MEGLMLKAGQEWDSFSELEFHALDHLSTFLYIYFFSKIPSPISHIFQPLIGKSEGCFTLRYITCYSAIQLTDWFHKLGRRHTGNTLFCTPTSILSYLFHCLLVASDSQTGFDNLKENPKPSSLLSTSFALCSVLSFTFSFLQQAPLSCPQPGEVMPPVMQDPHVGPLIYTTSAINLPVTALAPLAPSPTRYCVNKHK